MKPYKIVSVSRVMSYLLYLYHQSLRTLLQMMLVVQRKISLVLATVAITCINKYSGDLKLIKSEY